MTEPPRWKITSPYKIFSKKYSAGGINRGSIGLWGADGGFEKVTVCDPFEIMREDDDVTDEPRRPNARVGGE